MELNVENIISLMDRVAEDQLTRLEIESEGVKLVIEGAKTEMVLPPMPAVPMPIPAAAPAQAGQAPAAAPVQEKEVRGQVVKSPIVGTFYHSAAPEKPPFVSVGTRVKKGDTLFIIESMKLMNEVPSEFDGVVADILIDNAQPVEFGQPVMVIDPA
ncbi:acetyl-CoA carboxylase biotin carboxyl carrier protein [Zongyangia hominis]|uniref:Biotin carboxyl carrier protein of acetyl-CoA carboxylase n=1 Tax=Zongyangia hominis TaxID=2763677 RepID=A0A926IBM2_9FIRM|nr:acetyl-CoA carboxylase biotin carboxyl carrier protein [Zongyangia hominis]MBC8570240.1 acetyl-CoA carboxylase biotin carboxyl carrier protein [Zongyangia hominis]